MKTRGAANHHDVQRLMFEESFQIFVDRAAIELGHARGLVSIFPVDCRNLDASYFSRRPRMRFANISGADNSDVGHS